MSVVHELKTWPTYFDAVKRDEKPFEVRRDDRGYQKGDVLRLRRYEVGMGFTRNCEPIEREITYVLTGGQFGIEPGYVVLGLRNATRPHGAKDG